MPPKIEPNALILYIEEMNDNPLDGLNLKSLYTITSNQEATCTLKKGEKYLFYIERCEIDSNYGSIGPTVPVLSAKIIYNSVSLKVTDYAYFANDKEDPITWGFGEWSVYVVESMPDIEETTIGFYDYPFLLKVKLQFE